MRRLFAFCILLTFPLSITHANPLLKGFTAEYDVIRNGIYLGVSKRQLVQRDGSTFDYFSHTKPEGFVALLVSDIFTEHSVIQLHENNIRPVSYAYQQSGGKTEKTFQAGFDWQKQQLVRSNDADSKTLAANTQDLLSFQIAIINGLSQGIRHFDFTIVDHKRIQPHTLNYTATETMNSLGGKLSVLRLEHKNNRKKDRFTFWCAEKLHYLPVMIRKLEHDGDVVLLRLRKFNGQTINLVDKDNK